MREAEKLQSAVRLTIAAGYQLDKGAFEFLSLLAATEDPSDIMHKAIERAGSLAERPLFIGRTLLEEIAQKKELPQEPFLQPVEAFPQGREAAEAQAIGARRAFDPVSRGFESDVEIVEDPGAKLNSGGGIEDYLGYFRDRYRRLERLLKQRIDVRGAASIIDALRAVGNSRLRVVGMITEKRESKQRTILTLEDMYASATALVPQNAPGEVRKKARSLLLDQVICLGVRKTSGSLLIVEDIILPDVAQRASHKSPVPAYAVLTSDMHVGSAKFQRETFNRFILWLNGKYGDEKTKEIASHVKYILIAGDIVDGIGVYPNQVKELAVRDVHKQYRLAAKYLEQIPDYIEVIIAPGNHDAPRKALPQPPISNAFLETLQESRKVRSLGNPCLLSLHGVETLMFHGRSLDDIVSTVPDMSHSHPEKAMRLLLQSRHLAPLYGGKTPLAPEARDPLVIERVPDIFHAGHVHALEYGSYRGVLIVNSGCWQDQTDYMRRNGFVPTPGKAPVVNLQTMEVNVVPFS